MTPNHFHFNLLPGIFKASAHHIFMGSRKTLGLWTSRFIRTLIYDSGGAGDDEFAPLTHDEDLEFGARPPADIS
jgi:hypothetical protein